MDPSGDKYFDIWLCLLTSMSIVKRLQLKTSRDVTLTNAYIRDLPHGIL